jgi:hypothetical protein
MRYRATYLTAIKKANDTFSHLQNDSTSSRTQTSTKQSMYQSYN